MRVQGHLCRFILCGDRLRLCRTLLCRIRVDDPVGWQRLHLCLRNLGELVAWIIGWDLVLEYAAGAATVSIAWSEYFNRVLDSFGLRIPSSGVIRHSKRPWTQASTELLIFPPYSFCFFSRRSLSKGPKSRPWSTVLS